MAHRVEMKYNIIAKRKNYGWARLSRNGIIIVAYTPITRTKQKWERDEQPFILLVSF